MANFNLRFCEETCRGSVEVSTCHAARVDSSNNLPFKKGLGSEL